MNSSRTGSVQILPTGGNTSNLTLHSADLYNDIYHRSMPNKTVFDDIGQKTFLEDLQKRRCKIVQVIYKRIAQNPKELTVARNEFLEVLL